MSRFLDSNIIFLSLFAHLAVFYIYGRHRRLANFLLSFKFSNSGSSEDISGRIKFLSIVKIIHCDKKCSSVSSSALDNVMRGCCVPVSGVLLRGVVRPSTVQPGVVVGFGLL